MKASTPEEAFRPDPLENNIRTKRSLANGLANESNRPVRIICVRFK